MPSTEDYSAAGLYDPGSNAASDRLELLEWLDELGFTLDEMVDGLHGDALGTMASDRRIVPGKRLSRADSIAASGIEPDDFDAYVRALGFNRIGGAQAGELGITHSEATAIGAFGALAEVFTRDEALGFLRVLGSSISRVGEAAVAAFLSDVESEMVTSGYQELELAMRSREAVGLLDQLGTHLDLVMRRHVLQAAERTRRAMTSDDQGLQFRYAIGFVDLVGFTELSIGMNPKTLSGFIREFEGRAHDVVTAAGARVVKLIGDEVMFAATDPGAACRAASALMDGFATELTHVVPRGGLAFGSVLVRGGDYYGTIVNLASRVVDEAVPEEVLVTQELADNADETCRFEPAGRRRVKGFADPVRVHSLVSC